MRPSIREMDVRRNLYHTKIENRHLLQTVQEFFVNVKRKSGCHGLIKRATSLRPSPNARDQQPNFVLFSKVP